MKECQKCRMTWEDAYGYCGRCGQLLAVRHEGQPASPPPVISATAPNYGRAAMVATAALFGLMVWIYILGSNEPRESTTTTPEKERSPAEQVQWMCKFLHAQYDRKPVGEIPLKDAELIGNCKQLGIW